MEQFPRRQYRRPESQAGNIALTRRGLLWLIGACFLAIFFLWATANVTISKGGAGGESRPNAPSPIDTSRRGPSVIDYDRLDRRLRQLAADDSIVGLAVAVVEDGQIRFLQGYGETVAGSGDPVTPHTVFRWASVSKGVAADMVALLAARNRISLYEPIAKYAVSLRLPGGNEHKATISDLLSHRLGLFSHAADSKLEDDMDPRMLRRSLAELNATCPPGTCHAYQNVAYDAASEIVEKLTGQRYEDAVRANLFRPLGMTSATISRAGLMSAPSWARPYSGGRNGRPVEVTEAYYRVPAAGGVNSSIKDLALWMRAQMGVATDVLPASVLQAVQSERSVTPGELARMRKFRERIASASYGLGWRIYDYAGHRVIGHRGGVRGYRSLVMFDPARKTGVAALWNSSTNQPGGVEFEVMDMLYKLPPRDWLGIDSRPTPAQPAPEEAGNVSIGTGGN